MEKVSIGSLFSGIGGFELGAQWAFENADIPHEVLFQVEQNKYCQSILEKHWPNVPIFDDVRSVGRHNVKTPDILVGGFPCQSISVCGQRRGLNDEKKSGLWFEMLRVISELRCPIVVMENVSNVLRLGGPEVIGGLAEIGYDCEWTIVSARQFGAPHLRRRWFCIATDADLIRLQTTRTKQQTARTLKCRELGAFATNSDRAHSQKQSMYTESIVGQTSSMFKFNCRQNREIENPWQKGAPFSPLCSVDDGVPDRVARLKALGNAIVPQCSEYIFKKLILSDYFQNFLSRRRHGKSTQSTPQIYERT